MYILSVFGNSLCTLTPKEIEQGCKPPNNPDYLRAGFMSEANTNAYLQIMISWEKKVHDTGDKHFFLFYGITLNI